MKRCLKFEMVSSHDKETIFGSPSIPMLVQGRLDDEFKSSLFSTLKLFIV